MEQSKEEKKKDSQLIWWGPVDSAQKALKIKEGFSGWLIGLALLQFILGIGIFIYTTITGERAFLEIAATVLVSSVVYTLLGSLLFKFSSRVLAIAIMLFTVWNFISALPAGVSGGGSVLYLAIIWLAGRTVYSLFKLHKEWPEVRGSKSKFPKAFRILYVLMGVFLIFLVGTIILGMFL